MRLSKSFVVRRRGMLPPSDESSSPLSEFPGLILAKDSPLLQGGPASAEMYSEIIDGPHCTPASTSIIEALPLRRLRHRSATT